MSWKRNFLECPFETTTKRYSRLDGNDTHGHDWVRYKFKKNISQSHLQSYQQYIIETAV